MNNDAVLSDYLNLRYFVLDLQLFSAEDEGRTEHPTDTKKRKAKEEGQVLKSQDLVAYVSLFSSFFSFFLFFKVIFNHLNAIFTFFLSTDLEFTLQNIAYMIKFLGIEILYILLPIFLPPIVLGSMSSILQTGFIFVPKLVMPDIKRVMPNINSYLKKVFGRKGRVQFIKSLVLVIGLLLILWFTISQKLYTLFYSSGDSIQKTLLLFISLFKTILFRIAVLLIIFVVIDFTYQRWEYFESLKMSKQELLQEIYEQEGRPEINQALNQKRKEIMKRKSMAEVKHADVVITNPTHYAIALKYEAGKDTAPKVIAKGADLLAMRIREIAFENDIIIYENKPLARELYKRIDIGDIIPADLFEIVAEIFSYVYKEYGKRGKKIGIV